MAKEKKGKQLTFENGQPCGEEKCGAPKTRKPCKGCGRIQARGKSIIKVRTGPVYLERLTPGNISIYKELSKKEQEKAELVIWLSPGTDISEIKIEG